MLDKIKSSRWDWPVAWVVLRCVDRISKKTKKKLLMRTFEKFFRNKVSYEMIDKYVNLVRKTLDPDDEIEVYYEEQDDAQFVRIYVLDRVLH